MKALQPKWQIYFVIAYDRNYQYFIRGDNRFFLSEKLDEYPSDHAARAEIALEHFDRKFSRILGEEAELIDIVEGMESDPLGNHAVIDGVSVMLVSLSTDQDYNQDRAKRMRGYLLKHYQDRETVANEIQSKWFTQPQLESIADLFASDFQTVIAHLPSL